MLTDPLNTQQAAERIYHGLLVPAAETPAKDWHEFYKWINRAAGAIAGHSLAVAAGFEDRAGAGLGGRLTPEMVAQQLVEAVFILLDAHQPGLRDSREKIQGPKGLSVRVVKCLASLQGITADRAVLS